MDVLNWIPNWSNKKENKTLTVDDTMSVHIKQLEEEVVKSARGGDGS
ncbi:hypothetical protein [Bacillus phage BM-P1]|nr:hypothetical protein [Bacillus phage BM-P1]